MFAAKTVLSGSVGLVLCCCFVIAKCSGESSEKLPAAEKLTISIDSVSPALPPQIAYYVPDSAVFDLLNRSFARDAAVNRTLQTNLQPPPMPTMPPMPPTFPANSWDTMAMSQNNYHFVTSADSSERRRMSAETDSAVAAQNYNYSVEYSPVDDRHETDGHSAQPKRHKPVKTKPKKRIKLPSNRFYLNFGSGNLRKKIKELQAKHRDEFPAEDYDDDAREEEEDEASIEPIVIPKKKHRKFKKPKTARKKPLRRPAPTSSSEHELVDYYPAPARQPCSQSEESDCDEENDAPRPRPHNKQFTIYLTKVHRDDRNNKQALKQRYVLKRKRDSDESESDFVPSRLLSSVRRTEKVVRKHRPSGRQPRIVEQINESGGHIVYTEDGYDDKEFDHGSEERRGKFRRIRRKRRSAEEFEILPIPEELKGQELLDHLTNLIQNATDTLSITSEELRNRPFPLYNSSRAAVRESPIRYMEKVAAFNGSETDDYYSTKTKNCEDISERDDKFGDSSTSSSPQRRRLEGLGDKIGCLKEKLFGEEPLNNPLFLEQTVQQPSSDSLVGADSHVYDDIMQNIGLNKNQRVFSSYGVSDNFDLNGIGTLSVKNRPDNSLNTNEEYTPSSGESQSSGGSSGSSNESSGSVGSSESRDDSEAVEDKPVSERAKPETPSYNPPNVAILDISKFIPRPYAYSPDRFNYESDFIPVTRNTAPPQPAPTKPTVSSTTTSAAPQHFNGVRGSPERFQRNKAAGTFQLPSNVPVPIPLPLLVQQLLHPNNLQRYRGPSNVVIYRQRKPIAVIRLGPNFLN